MAKGRWFKNTVEWGGNFSNVWGLLPAAWQTFVTAGFTALTAWYGFHEVGWARAIFYSSGVLAFGMTTVFLSLRIAQILGTFQRLTVVGFGITSISVIKNNTEIEHINLNAILRNDSQRPMFYRLRRSNVVLEQRAPVSSVVETNIIVIPAFGGTQVIGFATIDHIPIQKKGNGPAPAPAGQIDLEIEYGPAADELEFCLRQVTTVGIGIFTPSGTKQQQAQLITQIKVLEHSKV